MVIALKNSVFLWLSELWYACSRRVMPARFRTDCSLEKMEREQRGKDFLVGWSWWILLHLKDKKGQEWPLGLSGLDW